MVVLPPPKPTEAPAMAAPEELFTVPETEPALEPRIMAGALTVEPATTVTVCEPLANPVAEAVIVADPAGRLARVYAPVELVLTVTPSALTLAPETPAPVLLTTVPVTVPGLIGVSASVVAVVLLPAVTVALSELVLYPARAAEIVTVPGARFVKDQVPSDAVAAWLVPTVTFAPSSGAPEELVTLPFRPPVVAPPDAILMILATDGTPDPFRIKSM